MEKSFSDKGLRAEHGVRLGHERVVGGEQALRLRPATRQTALVVLNKTKSVSKVVSGPIWTIDGVLVRTPTCGPVAFGLGVFLEGVLALDLLVACASVFVFFARFPPFLFFFWWAGVFF